jgi:hypothetical protein
MTTYHALQILGMTDAAMTLAQIDSKAIDQMGADDLYEELKAALGQALVTHNGGVWELTPAGRDLYC